MSANKATSHHQPSVPPPPTRTVYPLTSPRGGGTKLATRVWAPPPTGDGIQNKIISAVVLVVHGAGWHSGYFSGLAEHLAGAAAATQSSLFVAAYDQPSCGYSDVDRDAPGQDGSVTHIYSIDELVEEVYEAADWARKEAGVSQQTPLILLGESFGGIQVLSAVLDEKRRRDANVVGVIVLGALIRPVEMPPKLLVRIINWLAPYYAKLRMPAAVVDYSSATSFDEAFGDPNWARVARSDPKVRVSPQFTLGAASAILTAGESLLLTTATASDATTASSTTFPVPVLAIHGRHDCRTQCDAVREFAERIGTDRAELLIVDTNGHQLLQDRPEVSLQVMDKIASWIDQLLSAVDQVA